MGVFKKQNVESSPSSSVSNSSGEVVEVVETFPITQGVTEFPLPSSISGEFSASEIDSYLIKRTSGNFILEVEEFIDESSGSPTLLFKDAIDTNSSYEITITYK